MHGHHRLPFLIAFSNILVFAVINISQMVFRTSIYYVVPQEVVGYDYRDFYYASAYVAGGESPYSVSRYVTPPLPAVANLIFLPLGFESARNLFLAFIPLAVLLSYLVIYLALRDPGSKDGTWLLLSGFFAIACSYPFYFLFERGNIDGVVLLCMCAGLYFMTKRVELGAFLLAFASLLKLYPILLLGSLLFSRRWKAFFWTCGWMVLLILLTGPYWDEYFASSSQRSSYFRLDENGSLANTFMIMLVFAQSILTGKMTTLFEQSSSVLTAIVFGITAITSLYHDYKITAHASQKEYVANALFYFPLMVAIPQTVYHYEFVLLIPLFLVLSFLWRDGLSLLKKCCLTVIATGIALSQWQAIALYEITGNMLAHYIPGFGLLLVVLGVFAYKFSELRGAISRDRTPGTKALGTA